MDFVKSSHFDGTIVWKKPSFFLLILSDTIQNGTFKSIFNVVSEKEERSLEEI